MKYLITIVILLFFLSCSTKQSEIPALIPFPQKMELKNGLEKSSTVSFQTDSLFQSEKIILEKWLTQNGIETNENSDFKIKLIKANVENPYKFEGAYNLIVSNKIEIIAPNATGIFYGIQTLKQLIEFDGGKLTVPHCEINDWPAFQIRGFMHDVGRNYQNPDLLKEQIEVLAAYKYNVFHLHLTDYHGWRLESKIYPELQSEEATSRKPGKFYKQEEFKDIVEFCWQRHITVIPELDVPGHTKAFREALNLKSMNSSEVQKIIIELIDEICTLATPEKMPYIHLGTDEVREPEEMVDEGYLIPLIAQIEENKRKYISWWHGIQSPGDSTSIKQLWAQFEPLDRHPFIDSRSNYINHLDPLAGIGRLFFQQPCRAEHGDSLRLGGILCCWPDNLVDDERKILLQNSVYPFMVTYSEAIWRGVKSTGDKYWAQLPAVNSAEYENYKKFENRLAVHRDKNFNDKEFPFVKSAHIPWKIIGPFNHDGNFSKVFEVEKEIKNTYNIDGKNYFWNDTLLFGGTIHLKHFFGFPSPIHEKEGTVYAMNYIYSEKEQEVGFWIGFQNWSRSGRRGGPTAESGQWHFTNPKIWVNDMEIQPPVWKQPGLESNASEIPFVDEDYYYRQPTTIKLNKGWNKFLLKIPFGGNAWKWMFTCVPVDLTENGVREVYDLKYSTEKL